MKLISLMKKLPRFSVLRPLSKKETPPGWIPLWYASVVNLTVCYINLGIHFYTGGLMALLSSTFGLIVVIAGLALIKYQTQKDIWEMVQQQYQSSWDDDGSNSAGP